GRAPAPRAPAQALGRLLSGVLGGALRAERVLLRNEDTVLELAFDAHLPSHLEHVRDRAGVDDRHARRARDVADAEAGPVRVRVSGRCSGHLADERDLAFVAVQLAR